MEQRSFVVASVVTGDKSPRRSITRGDEEACLLIRFILMQVEDTAFSVLFIMLPSGQRKAFACFIYLFLDKGVLGWI